MSEALQNRDPHPDTPCITPLHLFAGALIGTPFDLSSARIVALVAYAQREAAQRIAANRAPVGKRSVLPFAVLYRDLRAEAARAPAPPLPKSASLRRRVLVATCALRHRQRAALLLRYSGGFPFDEIGPVLGVKASQAEEVVHAAAGRVAAAVGRPIDLGSSLRIRKSASKPVRKSEPARLPRGIVRMLVAPPVAVSFELRSRPVETIVRWQHTEFARPKASKRRMFFAAFVVAMLLLSLTPVSSSRREAVTTNRAHITSIWQVNLPVFATPQSAPQTIVVRRGDSLWSIARSALGNPERWREVWSLNLGRTMQLGERFVAPDVIRPGWRLLLPPH